MTAWERWDRRSLPSLGAGLADVLITGVGDAAPGGGFRRVEPDAAQFLLREWLASGEPRARLAAIWAAQSGRHVDLAPHPGVDERETRRICEWLSEQRLVLWLRDRAAASAAGSGPTKQAPSPQGDTKTTWVEIVLVDQIGTPLGREAFALTTPGGSKISAALDANGFARLDGLVAGTCDISFPRIDGREWGRGLPPAPLTGGEAISHIHQVRQGEDASTIAALYGFRHWQTVWSHEANAGLRRTRDPNVLFPGDEVSIPARIERMEEGGTAARHRFVALVASRKLHVILLGLDERPLANAQYTLWLGDAAIAEDSTDASGALERSIPLGARELTLDSALGIFTLEVGALNPLDSVEDDGVSGAQGRLNNLGYDAGPVDGHLGPRTQDAVLRFQKGEGLEPSGVLDNATKSKLRSRHGS